MKAVLIQPGALPAVADVGDNDGQVHTYLREIFPDSFDGIRLGPDVIGYVRDTGLIDGSPYNPAALALADAVYLHHAGRTYHTAVGGPMVVLGVTRGGASTDVPGAFIEHFLPQLAGGAGQ